MKFTLIAIYTVATCLVLFFFGSIEQQFINSDFSWTGSKVAPYLLLIILGVLIARWFTKFLIYKLVSNRLKFAKPFIFFAIMVIPFMIGFAMNPIYEGDFSKQGTEILKTEKLSDFKNVDLAVITIPGCPHCYHSISKLKQLKSRNPKLRIKFIVCTSNSEELKDYLAEGGTEILVSKTKNIEILQNLAEGKFPTFVMIKENKAVYRWSNDQFGCMAMDQLENELNK